MANNEGTVSVRFSVADKEVVRQALADLGKDGDAALAKLNAAGDKPSSGLKALSDIISGLKDRVIGLAVPLGPVGSALISFGPIGIVAAAGLGLAWTAMWKLAEMANVLGDKAIHVREFASTTGLTTDQVQALTQAAANHGVVAEQVTGAIQKFAAGWEQMRRGGGVMLEEINRINPALALQMQQAGSTAAAWDIFAKAVDRADASQRSLLLRAAGGRGGVTALSGALADTAKVGGLDNLTTNAKAAGDVIDKELIRRLAELKAKADSLGQSLYDKIAGFGAENALKHSIELREDLIKIVNLLENFSPSQAWKDFMEWGKGNMFAPGPARITVNKMPDPGFRQSPADPALRDQLAPVPLSPEAQLENQRKMIAVLGSAVTPAEQYELKIQEINVAIDKNSDLEQYRGRAVAAAALATKQTIEALKERAGVASQEEITNTRLAQTYDDLAKAGVKSADARATAEKIVRREAQQTAEAIKVRASDTPALTKLTQDADKLRLNLDAGLATALQGTTSDMIAMARGTETASQGIANMTNKLVDAVANAVLLKTVVQPIAAIFSGGLSSLATAFGFSEGGIMTSSGPLPLKKYASGGVANSPQVSIWGEGKLPEANVPLPDGRSIPVTLSGIPSNDNGPREVRNHFSFDLKGANGDDAIKSIVAQGVAQGIAISDRRLAQYDRNLPGRIQKLNQRAL